MKVDPQIEHVETNGKIIHVPDGKEFRFTNAQSRERAVQNLNSHGRAYIHRAEGIAGRALSRRELRDGVANRPDNRSTVEKVRQQSRQAVSVRPGEEHPVQDLNPFRRVMAEGLHKRRGPSDPLPSREERLQAAADKWDVENAVRVAQEKFDSDPVRVKAIQEAERAVTEMKFDPSIPTDAYEDARHRLQLARRGNLTLYEIEKQKFADWLTLRTEEQKAELDRDMATLKERRESLDSLASRLGMENEGADSES